MFDRTDVLWREETPTREPPATPARDDAPTDDLARQVIRRRHDSPDDAARDERSRDAHLAGLTQHDRGRAARAFDERAHLARERHARIDQEHARRARAGKTAPDDRARSGRAGHRRERAGRAHAVTGRSRTERLRAATADVGIYRAVSYTDLSDQHCDGHPFTTLRLVTQMTRAGLIEEHEATGPHGHTFTVLTATARGKDAAHRAALDTGHVPEQRTWSGLVKPAELSHDTAVYRAALDERARIEADGGRVVRVRLDAELKAIVASATEKARAEAGDRAAGDAKAAAAHALGLPVHDTRVMYPDAQLDIEDADGVSGRVNVEIASDHYHAAAIVAKAGAGFALHGSSRSATRNIARALARETDSGPGGGSPSAGRDGSVEL